MEMYWGRTVSANWRGELIGPSAPIASTGGREIGDSTSLRNTNTDRNGYVERHVDVDLLRQEACKTRDFR